MNDELLNDDDLNTIDPGKNYLEALVGEDKKFKSPEDLARGKYEADLYINTLTKRMDELRNDYVQLRQDYNTKAKLEEVLDQLKTKQQSGSDNEPLAKDVDLKPEYKPEDLVNVIRSEMQRNKQAEQEEMNYKQVQAKLKERFGGNREALNQHLQDLGLSEDFAKELARKHPNVFMRTLGLDQPAQQDDFLAPPRSSVRRDTFAPKTEERTWAWYEKLRLSNPEKYRSKEITVQMHKDYERLGPKFEDGNFHQQDDRFLFQG